MYVAYHMCVRCDGRDVPPRRADIAFAPFISRPNPHPAEFHIGALRSDSGIPLSDMSTP
jgi:hypothetical protein